jgi:glycosyltransferase involved in cell wall biosynthesis
MALTKEEIEKRIVDSYEIPNRVLEAVEKPMVTIRTSTYNHGQYIRKCIEGVLMQETDFQVEYIIGEDCSTDDTRKIVMEYAEKYPDVIRVITADYNVGAKANGQRCIRQIRGKYMALCEGDDYWTDPHKLQKQVDFLELNPECSACFHQVNRVDASGFFIAPFTEVIQDYFVVDDVLLKTRHHTSSLLMRNYAWLKVLPKWSNQVFLGDRLLAIFLANEGPLGFINLTMSSYRLHDGGIHTGSEELDLLKKYLIMYEQFFKNLTELDIELRRELAEQCRVYHRRLLRASLKSLSLSGMVTAILHCWVWTLKAK